MYQRWHAGHDVADAAPAIEALVEELKLRLVRLQAEKAERRAEQPAARV